MAQKLKNAHGSEVSATVLATKRPVGVAPEVNLAHR